MKKLIPILLVCSLSYGLNAPYLISATALSDSSVELSWRNNDAGTTGFIVQRKDSTEIVYHFVDSVKSPTQLTYTDMNGLLPVTLYTYQVIAYSAAEVSDTSNSLQVVTPARQIIFNQPSVSIYWNFDTSGAVKIRISDNANCETGYRIYRDEDFSSSFSLISQITSTNPEQMDSIIWYDNSVSPNTWYNYHIAAYTSSDSIFSSPCSTYTFQVIQPQEVVKLQKISDFPVSDSGSWSVKIGDSIILKESNAPAGMFTVINISDPANPLFAGYIDSATALSYPLHTLMPIYLRFGVSDRYGYSGSNRYLLHNNVMSWKNGVLVLTDSILTMYSIIDTSLVPVDTLNINLSGYSYSILLLNDSLLTVEHENSGTFNRDKFFSPIRLLSSGFSLLPECPIGRYYYITGAYDIYRNYIRGLHNENILVSSSRTYKSGQMQPILYFSYITIYNINALKQIKLSGTTSDAGELYNTGRYLSSTENLCKRR